MKLIQNKLKSDLNIFAKYILMCILFIPAFVFAQGKLENEQKKINFGLAFGLNFTKMTSDTLDVRFGTKPYAGLDFTWSMHKKAALKTAVFYSMRGSKVVTPHVRFENAYIDFLLLPFWVPTNDLSLHAGVGYSYCLNSNSVYLSETNGQNTIRVNNKNLINEFTLAGAVSCRLSKRSDLFINYVYPLSENSFHCVQLGLKINLTSEKKSGFNRKEIQKNNAQKDILAMKNGVLLVRLKTSEHRINSLIKSGKTEEAKQVSEDQRKENLSIIQSYRKHFDFCRVMFFYSNHSSEVKNKSFENIFLTDSLTVDKKLFIDSAVAVYIAEIGILNQDTVKYRTEYFKGSNVSIKSEEIYSYYVPLNGMNLTSLRILNNDFVQLNEPFPYFTRVFFQDLGEKNKKTSELLQQNAFKEIDDSIDKMNKKLWDYYNQLNSQK